MTLPPFDPVLPHVNDACEYPPIGDVDDVSADRAGVLDHILAALLMGVPAFGADLDEGHPRLHEAAGAQEIMSLAGRLPHWRRGDNLERFIETCRKYDVRVVLSRRGKTPRKG